MATSTPNSVPDRSPGDHRDRTDDDNPDDAGSQGWSGPAPADERPPVAPENGSGGEHDGDRSETGDGDE